METKEEFFKSLDLDFNILDYIDLDNIESFEDLAEQLEDKFAEIGEIIYYSNALNYLEENDPSLRESTQIANEMGFETENINSELLASLHNEQRLREQFYELQDEIEDFFDNL